MVGFGRSSFWEGTFTWHTSENLVRKPIRSYFDEFFTRLSDPGLHRKETAGWACFKKNKKKRLLTLAGLSGIPWLFRWRVDTS